MRCRLQVSIAVIVAAVPFVMHKATTKKHINFKHKWQSIKYIHRKINKAKKTGKNVPSGTEKRDIEISGRRALSKSLMYKILQLIQLHKGWSGLFCFLCLASVGTL